MKKCKLKNVIELLKEVQLHVQSKSEMLVIADKITEAIRILEAKLNKNRTSSISKAQVLKILGEVLQCIPSILALISKFISSP